MNAIFIHEISSWDITWKTKVKKVETAHYYSVDLVVYGWNSMMHFKENDRSRLRCYLVISTDELRSPRQPCVYPCLYPTFDPRTFHVRQECDDSSIRHSVTTQVWWQQYQALRNDTSVVTAVSGTP
jgi:hypothetical protein